MTGDLSAILAEIAGRPGCRVLPPAGQPPSIPDWDVPQDIAEFYRLCGGLLLFDQAPYAWRVSGPSGLVPASPRLLTPDLAARVAVEYPDDLTNGCYVIADGGNGMSTEPHVVVDLHPARAGRCYAAFWDTYGLVDQMPVVARDVAGLLRWLLASDPQTGDAPDTAYGDAYD
ncbi:MAG TPA: hypothetical protein VF062_02430 [Candidatus Limnocylindrales bacterium]